MNERIVAVGLLTQRELSLLGPTFERVWPVEEAPHFNEMLRVDYSRPGSFEWRPTSWYRWVVPTEEGTRVPRPYLREPTQEAALQAARRYFPQVAAALAVKFNDPKRDNAGTEYVISLQD